MPNEGYMDAAAVPVPDAGDDTLRREMAEAISERLFRGGEYNSITIGRYTSLPGSLADALLPLIREHVAAAWDEGWRAGQGDEFEAREGREREESANPYRDVIEQSVMREGIADAIMLTSHNGMDCGPDQILDREADR